MTRLTPGDTVVICANTCNGERATIRRRVEAGVTFVEAHYVVEVLSTGRCLSFMPHELVRAHG